jgi:phage shock protein PspC (stress-responsive transcriptional regulator)
MKKTINVTVGGLVFSIEEDGYDRLHDYLESLKVHFSNLSYGAEVIADIEARIAEQFNAKNSGNTQRAITMPDVEEVLKAIGSVEDFGGGEAAPKTANPIASKKLYRNSDDVIIAGVGSGLAAYFGIDTTLARVILFATVLAGGWGLLLYLLLWLILPEAKTAGQKMEMKGSPITIKQIEQTAKEKISEVRSSGAGRKIGNFLGMLIKIFVRVILAIIGVAVTFAAAVASFAVTFSFANVLFNRNSPYIDFPISSIFHGGEYFLALILGFVTVLVPLIYLALGGITLIRLKRPPVNGLLASVLAIIWVVAAIGTGVFAINKAPAIQAAANEYRGNVETRTLQVSGFTKIDASSAYRVNIAPGKDYAVQVVGHTRDLDDSKMSVENGTLKLNQKGKICFFCWNDAITVTITTPALDSIKGSGAVDYTVGSFSGTDFNIDLSGASKASIESLTENSTMVELSGASSATLSGKSKTLNLDLSGASKFNGSNLVVDDATVDASGASHAEINATKTLSADASGASSIVYKGNPKIDKQDESGSSRIRPQ